MKFVLWCIIIVLVLRMLRKNIYITTYRSGRQQAQQDQQKPEGTVTVENMDKSKSKSRNGDPGDYVDYEEVK